MVGGGDAKELGEAREWGVGEVPDRVDPLPIKDRRGLSPDSPQCSNGQSVEEVDRGHVRDEEQAVRLGVRGGNLGDRLGGGNSDGCGQPDGFADTRADEAGDLGGRSQPAARPGDVEEGLVDGDLLEVGG